jgi:hypothetical protein
LRRFASAAADFSGGPERYLAGEDEGAHALRSAAQHVDALLGLEVTGVPRAILPAVGLRSSPPDGAQAPIARRSQFVDKHHYADGDMSDLAAPREVLLVHGAGL